MGRKEFVKNLFFILIVAVLVFFIVKYYNNYMDDKEAIEEGREDKELLEKALDERDVSYCENHSEKMKCVVILGKNTAEESYCEQGFENSREIITCKALVFGDKDFCEENLDSEKADYCKEKFENITSDLD